MELRLAHPLTGDLLDPDFARVLSACGWTETLPSPWLGTDTAL